MPVAERSAADAAQRIADALEGAGLSYAIGGALALAIAGVPRGTADVDVNVFVPGRWIADMMGDEDERTRRWDEITTRYAFSETE